MVTKFSRNIRAGFVTFTYIKKMTAGKLDESEGKNNKANANLFSLI